MFAIVFDHGEGIFPNFFSDGFPQISLSSEVRGSEKHNYILLNLSSNQNASGLPKVENNTLTMTLYDFCIIHFDNILATVRCFVVALKTGKDCQYVAPRALGSPTNS